MYRCACIYHQKTWAQSSRSQATAEEVGGPQSPPTEGSGPWPLRGSWPVDPSLGDSCCGAESRAQWSRHGVCLWTSEAPLWRSHGRKTSDTKRIPDEQRYLIPERTLYIMDTRMLSASALFFKDNIDFSPKMLTLRHSEYRSVFNGSFNAREPKPQDLNHQKI